MSSAKSEEVWAGETLVDPETGIERFPRRALQVLGCDRCQGEIPVGAFFSRYRDKAATHPGIRYTFCCQCVPLPGLDYLLEQEAQFKLKWAREWGYCERAWGMDVKNPYPEGSAQASEWAIGYGSPQSPGGGDSVR